MIRSAHVPAPAGRSGDRDAGRPAPGSTARLGRVDHPAPDSVARPGERGRAAPGFLAPLAREFARTLVDLVLPSQCAGCGTWDEVLCAECAALAEGPPSIGRFDPVESAPVSESSSEPSSARPSPRTGAMADAPTGEPSARRGARAPDAAGAIPLVSLGVYDGRLRRILICAKHSPAFGAEDFLDRAGETLGRALGEELLRPRGAGDGEGAGGSATEWWVVPAPPSWRRRLFGRTVTTGFASGVARGLAAATGGGARVVDAVTPRLTARSQAGRGGRGRRDRRAGSMRARLPMPDPSRIVLVDDVLTTGATARELARVSGGAAGLVVLARVAAPSV